MIRFFENRDAAAITAIHNYYVENTIVTFNTIPMSEEEVLNEAMWAIGLGCPYLVYEDEGELLGYCHVFPWKGNTENGKVYEISVYLKPNAIGRGMGKRLMVAMIDECRERGVHSLISCIVEGNEVSIAISKQLGFEYVGRCYEVAYKLDSWLNVDDFELILN